LAAECAAQLEASKLIYWTEGEVMIDARTNTTLQSLSLKQATKLVDRWRATTTLEPGWAETDADLMRVMEKAVLALSRGVRRAHFIPPHKGTLLKELYTRDGTGILVSRDVYEGIRQAEAADVRAVAELIRPLEQEGILVPRSRDQLEKDMVEYLTHACIPTYCSVSVISTHYS
jgi:amino-acid N-acetyltransferase